MVERDGKEAREVGFWRFRGHGVDVAGGFSVLRHGPERLKGFSGMLMIPWFLTVWSFKVMKTSELTNFLAKRIDGGVAGWYLFLSLWILPDLTVHQLFPFSGTQNGQSLTI